MDFRNLGYSVRNGLVAIALVLLNACGGGGSSNPLEHPTTAGDFSISTTSVSFTSKKYGPAPAPQSINVHLLDAKSSAIVIGDGTAASHPAWLLITYQGSAPDFQINFRVSNTTLASGATYSVRLAIAAADSQGKVLQSKNVDVTYNYKDGIVVPTPLVTLGDASGFATQPATFGFSVLGSSTMQWTATSNASWLKGPTGTQTGMGGFTGTADYTTLPSGTYNGTITLTNAVDPTDQAQVDVTLTLTKPTINLYNANLTYLKLGGDSGLDMSAQPLKFFLGNFQRAYPWTLSGTTNSGGNWLQILTPSGQVSNDFPTAMIGVNPNLLAKGTYTGQLQLQVIINGEAINTSIPVTLNVDATRMVVSANGVAFSSFPTHSVLSRTVTVNTNLLQASSKWQASSNQSWLKPTASGNMGGALTLTADPAGLAPGQYFATVNVSSNSQVIVNSENIRVGFTVSATDPVNIARSNSSVHFISVANPVEPEWYASTGTAIEVYDVYTGALLRTLPAAGGQHDFMTISSDGAMLFVSQQFVSGGSVGERILAINPVDGNLLKTYTLYGTPRTYVGYSVAYARPDAHPVLLTSLDNESFDLSTGNRLSETLQSDGYIAIDPLQRTLFTHDINFLTKYALYYSTFNQPTFYAVKVDEKSLPGQYVSYSPNGDALLAAAGFPHAIEVLDPQSLQEQAFISMQNGAPTALETCWNGRVASLNYVSGVGGSASTSELFVYDRFYALVSTQTVGTATALPSALMFSGDCSRIIADGWFTQAQDTP